MHCKKPYVNIFGIVIKEVKNHERKISFTF